MPTARKGHGNRRIVIPLASQDVNKRWRSSSTMGRILGIGVCMYSSTAGSSSTVSTDGLGRIQKIYELCSNNKNFIVKDKLYKILYDKQLYQVAYDKLKSKPGNLTPGIIPTTLDGMSEEVIEEIIQKLKDGTFKFHPGRRIYIPKANGGERPLTIAPPRDKLVQECIRMILEAIYEPSFKDCSHGFRPNRSCHTALKALRQKSVMAK